MGLNDSLDGGLASDAPYVLTAGGQAGSTVPYQETWAEKYWSFQLTVLSFLFFTASFTCIGVLSAPMITDKQE